MKIDRSLNLVFPIETPNGEIYVHSTPIAHETYRQYFDVIGETVAKIHAKGLNIVAGPNIAGLMLRKIAEDAGRWDDADGRVGVANGLMAEIRRRTNVVVSSPQGWTTMPYEMALHREIFGAATQDAVEGGVVFFTLFASLHGFQRERLIAALVLSGMLSFWNGQIISLDSTEFARSLPISTETGNSGEMAEGSSARS